MKKLNLNPLALDKETIALLDEKQLREIVGGKGNLMPPDSTGCGSGASGCPADGNSTGCGSGASGCGAGNSSGCGSGASGCPVAD